MISLTHPSPQILDKIEMGVFSISRFLVKSLINKSFYNSRTSDDIDGIRTVARPDTSPTDTSPRTHPRQTVARSTLTRKTVARSNSNPTGESPDRTVNH